MADEHNPESKYRNVLAMKADEIEIFIALDNGNVEIYDRETLLLTFTIVGKFSVSPTVLDISDDLILVGYTASTFGKHRMTSSSNATRGSVRQVASGNHMQNGRKGPALPQNSWWKIFCRRTKQHLRTIEKTQVTRLYAASAAQQQTNTGPKNRNENNISEQECTSQPRASEVSSNQTAHNNNEDTSGYDYSYSEARLGPRNLIYFHSRLSVLSVDCNIGISKPLKDICDVTNSKRTSKNGDTNSDLGQSNNSHSIRIVRIASIADMTNSVIRAFDIDLNIILVGAKRTVFNKMESHSNYLYVFRNNENIICEDNEKKNLGVSSPDIYTSDEDEEQKNIKNTPTSLINQVSITSDSMRAILEIPLLKGYTPPGKDSDFDDAKCYIDTVQLLYPLCLVQMSNNGGSFEHESNLGQPYVCLVFIDVEKGTNLRIITFDQIWMRSTLKKFGESSFVPYDSDTSILVAKFNYTHLVLGFGSFSSRKDGCIAIFEMSDLLEFRDNNEEDEINSINNKIMSSITVCSSDTENYDISVYLLDPPTFHWSGWDDHCGGVGAIELDKYVKLRK